MLAGSKGFYQKRENKGLYSKDALNSNGKSLLQLASRNKQTIHHKQSHITWEAKYRKIMYKNRKQRYHHIRNWIDYILTRISHMQLPRNIKSYSGPHTLIDHKLVRTIATGNFEAKQIGTFERLKDPITRAKYAFPVEMHLVNKDHENNEKETQSGRNGTKSLMPARK